MIILKEGSGGVTKRFYGANKTNWKYILILLIVAVIGGFLIYRYWWLPKREAEIKFLSEILDKVRNINSIKYQLMILSDEKLISKQNIWRKGKGDETKVRIEIVPVFGERKFITLWDAREDLLYMYSPEDNLGRGGKIDYNPQLEGTEESFFNMSEVIKNTKPVIIGKEILEGKECLVVRNSNREGYWMKTWIWIEYGLPIRTITPVETIGGKIDPFRKNETRRENIELNVDIPDEIFKLPPEVQITPFD